MIWEVRFEIVKRIMSFLIKSSKGVNYVDKLENSYKNNLLITLSLILALLGLGSKYMSLYWFSDAAKLEYARLLKKEEDLYEETSITIKFAREQFNRAQELEKRNCFLLTKNKELIKQNEELLRKLEEK